jgi:hypothetical protein
VPGLFGPGTLAVLALVLAGCSSGHRDPVRLVPWDATVPAALQPWTGAPAPACQASALGVVGSGFEFSPAASGGTGRATLRNNGTSPCALTGRPDVLAVGAVPAPEQRRQPLPVQPPAFPTVVPPESVLQAMPPGGVATVDVEWRNWCVPSGPTAPVAPQALRLTLPSGSLDVGYNAVPPCDAPAEPSVLGVRPFQPAPMPATQAWTSTALQATIAPVSGKRGATVRYTVLIHNPSGQPVTFERCPMLVQLLAPAGRPEAYRLNCAAAGQLPAGGSLRFDMRIRIPADAPTGNNGLFWELDPTGSHGPEVTSRITVR